MICVQAFFFEGIRLHACATVARKGVSVNGGEIAGSWWVLDEINYVFAVGYANLLPGKKPFRLAQVGHFSRASRVLN